MRNLFASLSTACCRLLSIAWIAGVVFVLTSPVCASEAPEELLRNTIRASDWMASAHFKVSFEASSVVKAEDGTVERHHTSSGQVEIITDGPRLRYVKQNADRDGVPGMRMEVLVTPERRLMWVEDDFVQYTESPILIASAAALDRTLNEASWPLEGRVPLDRKRPVFDLAGALEEGKPLPEVVDEVVNGIPCKKVTVHGDGWQWECWVAPSRGYGLAKQVFVAEAREKVGRAAFRSTVDHVTFKEVNDASTGTSRWLAEAGTIEIASPGTKSTRITTIEVKRTAINLTPDYTELRAFETPQIPDGIEVLLETPDDQGQAAPRGPLRYVWKGGRVEPLHDPATIDRIRKEIEKAREEKAR